MAKYRHIYTTFWDDAKVMDNFTAEDRYFYLYLLTNKHTRQIGVYHVSKKQMALDLGYDVETVTALIERFEKELNLINVSDATGELAIINWGKYNLVKGGNPIIDCLIKDANEIKDKKLIKIIAKNTNNDTLKFVLDYCSDKNYVVRSELYNVLKYENNNKDSEQPTMNSNILQQRVTNLISLVQEGCEDIHNSGTIRQTIRRQKEKEKRENRSIGKEIDREREKENRRYVERNVERNVEFDAKKAISSLSPSPSSISEFTNAVIDLYNKICNTMPKARTNKAYITKMVKYAIQDVSSGVPDLGIFEKLFTKANDSDFLSGRNGKWEQCTLEWLLAPLTMKKVLRGDYDTFGRKNELDWSILDDR